MALRCGRRRLLQASLALAGIVLAPGCGIMPPHTQRPPRLPRIGVLDLGPNERVYEAFRQGLRDLGWVEGHNIAIERGSIERRGAESEEHRQEQLRELAAEFVRHDVDVIVAWGGDGIRAAMRVTTTIPIVMGAPQDAVASGYVASLARPGGNVTGLSALGAALSAKRVELLKDVAPGISTVAVLWNPGNPGAVPVFRETQAAAHSLGLRVQPLEVRDAGDFAGAFALAAREPADALVVFQEPINNAHTQQIVEFAGRQRLPAMYGGPGPPRQGGLMSYGPDPFALIRRAATYVDKILKGAKPADLPVEQPTTFDFIINLRTAQALGLTIPQAVLLQATEVIQ